MLNTKSCDVDLINTPRIGIGSFVYNLKDIEERWKRTFPKTYWIGNIRNARVVVGCEIKMIFETAT